jgi:proliferating cell nuclear antigen
MKCATSEEWKAIVATLQNLTEEAAFDIDTGGVRFRAMDPSHVALVDLVWDAAGFERFEFEGGEKDRFAVRVEDFGKIIKRADKNDAMSISRESGGPLLIKIGGNREFEFHLIDGKAAGGSTPLPKLNLASKFSIGRATFDSVLEDVSALSNNIRIRADPVGTLTFSGKGDSGGARITFSQGELVKFESPEESDAVYTMEYIQKVLKPASSSSEAIEFSFASKMPLAASVDVGDAVRSKLKLTFFLAPRASD